MMKRKRSMKNGRRYRRKYTKKTSKSLSKAIVRTVNKTLRKNVELKQNVDGLDYNTSFNSRLLAQPLGVNITTGPESWQMLGREAIVKSISWKGIFTHQTLIDVTPSAPVHLNIMVVRQLDRSASPGDVFYREGDGGNQPVPFDFVPNDATGDATRAQYLLNTKSYRILKKYKYTVWPHSVLSTSERPGAIEVKGYCKLNHKIMRTANGFSDPSNPTTMPNVIHTIVWTNQPDVVAPTAIASFKGQFFTNFTDM